MVNLTNRLPRAARAVRSKRRGRLAMMRERAGRLAMMRERAGRLAMMRERAGRLTMMRGRLPTMRGRAAGASGAARARGIAPRIAAVLGVFGLGALADRFVFDRQNARRRRHMARERNIAKLRRRARDTAKRARYLEGVAEGMAHKAAHAVPASNSHSEPADDLTLAQKVESEAFRHAGVSKAHVSVNAEDGTVFLRGRLDSDAEIDRLVKAASAIDGVERVENRLHAHEAATSDQGS
jgi:osmotically-inducible protein OsmY